MVNKSILVGRLTKTPELKATANGVSVCSFTLAVNRRFKNAEGNYDADFINCVAWRKQAEFLCGYFTKGSVVGICGSIQTRNYTNDDGDKVFITEVVADEVSFVGGKKEEAQPTAEDLDGYLPMPKDDDLPF